MPNNADDKKLKSYNRCKLSKVIYFDEGSATDYVQMIDGGQLIQTTELLQSDETAGKTDIETNVSIGFGKLFKSLIGFGGSVSTDANLNIGFRSDNLVRNILQNTILTDFLSVIGEKSSASDGIGGITALEGFRIEVAQDSLSYIMMVSPFMTMLKDSSAFNKGSNLDFDIDIEKIDSAIKMAKGYYEFIGSKDETPKIVLRFNIDSFKNNYRISDLLMMDLVFFAIKVGKTSLNKMAIEDAITASVALVEGQQIIDNPEYDSESQQNTQNNFDMDVYDVLLAGIKEM